MDQLDGRVEVDRRIMEYCQYIVFRDILPDLVLEQAEIEALKQIMKRKKSIFQHLKNPNDPNDVDKNDNKRHQWIVPYQVQSQFLKAKSVMTRMIMQKYYPHYKLKQSSVSVLYSEEGCEEQDIHYDYDPTCPFARLCFGCILFLEDDSAFVLMNGTEKVIERFQRGDMLVFRGDKAHAGASYPTKDIAIALLF
jgi:hypothetical protein